MSTQLLPVNTKVLIKGLQDDCGVGLIEGNIDQDLKAVRLYPELFTKKGRVYLSGKKSLNPKGKKQRIYCIPSQDIITFGSRKTTETSDDQRRKTSKTRSKAQ